MREDAAFCLGSAFSTPDKLLFGCGQHSRPYICVVFPSLVPVWIFLPGLSGFSFPRAGRLAFISYVVINFMILVAHSPQLLLLTVLQQVAPQGGVQWTVFQYLKQVRCVLHVTTVHPIVVASCIPLDRGTLCSPRCDPFSISLQTVGGHGNASNNMSPHLRFLCGAGAGITSQAAIYPLETVKTRLSAAPTGFYKGIAHCMRTVVQADGIRGLYRGLGTALIGRIPYSGVQPGLCLPRLSIRLSPSVLSFCQASGYQGLRVPNFNDGQCRTLACLSLICNRWVLDKAASQRSIPLTAYSSRPQVSSFRNSIALGSTTQ